ncbi:MASE3 domain-containing protein [Gudongella sp. DL1XJH-153]|uniref:MASE3 domain-containing protein n=1 Tax=Gudongella sp. DL1XJH-153 TaxID=3409804 RepID=UPI003BB6D424
MDNKKSNYMKNLMLYKRIIRIVLFSIILYMIAGINNDWFMGFMSIADYLTWHMIFEFASVLVSFSIFTVSYFVYEESKKLNMIVLGCAFLMMGTLDALHTFSFKGMSDFFIANTTANRATTLWILSRTFGSFGFLLAVLIPDSVKTDIKKGVFAGLTFSFSILLFLITTYYPNAFPLMLIEDSGLTITKIIMEYIIILIMAITFAVIMYKYKKTAQIREHQFMMALVFLIFSEFAFTNYGSVYDAFNYIGHIYKIIAYIILYKAIYIDNVSEPYREMKKAKNELSDYSDNLNLIVKQRTKDLEDANSMLMKDIEYAREMQLSLMPEHLPEDKSVSFHAEYIPAERLSGDFYNVIKLDEDNIAIYIGDVAGHGVSAAMLTVFANQNVEPLKEDENEFGKVVSPEAVLDSIYKSFNETNFNDETYILMLYGIYNKTTKLFTYASAGMNVSPYVIKNSGEILELNSRGFSICKLGDYILPTYENRKMQMEAGDKLLLYSDGLVEARNVNNEIYGQDKMKNFLKKHHSLDASDLEIELKRNLYDHIGSIERLKDDVTILIMHVK